MSKIGIIGSYLTEFKGRRENENRNQLINETVVSVLEDAQLSINDIDKVISASCDTIDGISISNAFAADDMGSYMKEESKVEDDGAYALMYAYYRMLTGEWKNCLLVAHAKPSDAGPAFYANMSCDPFYLRPMGLELNTSAALQARKYYETFGLSEEDAAEVAVKNRRAGSKNPRTQLRKEVSVQEVMNSSYLASPLKELESAPLTDGAAAVILSTEDFAKNAKNKPVWIDGFGFAQDNYYPGNRDLSRCNAGKTAAQKAYNEAGIKDLMQEVDFAEVCESYAFYEMMLYESLGLCKEGEGIKLIKDGVTDINGKFPVNPSGGTLCANPIIVSGLVRVIESYLQLTGKAGDNQVAQNKGKALVHAASGMFMQSNLVSILSI